MKKAYTLSEVLIVVVILGVVAALMIPSTIRRIEGSSNRTKIKKAMAVYETVLGKLVVENGIKSNGELTQFGGNNCNNTRAYFKSTQNGDDNCTFRASDGVWWNISDITHPVITIDKKGFDLQNLNNLNAQIKHEFDNTLFASEGVPDVPYNNVKTTSNYIEQLKIKAMDGNNNKVFAMVGHFDQNGILVVNEVNKETGTDLALLSKTYDFANNIKKETINTYKSENYGGYLPWQDAKNKCESNGSHLATKAELEALLTSGKLECNNASQYENFGCDFWTSDGELSFFEFSADARTRARYQTNDGKFKGGTYFAGEYMQTICIKDE